MFDFVATVREVEVVDDILRFPRQVCERDVELELAPAVLGDAEGGGCQDLFGFVAERIVEVVGDAGEDVGWDVGFGLGVDEHYFDGPVAQGETGHARVGVGAGVVLAHRDASRGVCWVEET